MKLTNPPKKQKNRGIPQKYPEKNEQEVKQSNFYNDPSKKQLDQGGHVWHQDQTHTVPHQEGHIEGFSSSVPPHSVQPLVGENQNGKATRCAFSHWNKQKRRPMFGYLEISGAIHW